MPVRVHFRFNKLTGEVETFTVDDQDRGLSEEAHDRVALEVGRVLARRPGVEEINVNTAPEPAPVPEAPSPDRQRQDRES